MFLRVDYLRTQWSIRWRSTVEHTVAVCPAWVEHHRVVSDLVGDGDRHWFMPWCGVRGTRMSPPSTKQSC